MVIKMSGNDERPLLSFNYSFDNMEENGRPCLYYKLANVLNMFGLERGLDENDVIHWLQIQRQVRLLPEPARGWVLDTFLPLAERNQLIRRDNGRVYRGERIHEWE